MRRGQSDRCAVHGVILLNKSHGDSSNRALQQVKRAFKAEKAGHCGTLDPLATGLLPIALGEATKFSQGLLEADKSYEFDIRLGQVTTTGDLEGEVIQTAPVGSFSAQDLEGLVARFSGAQTQIPPLYSALKLAGKPLYEYARAGLSVEVAPRSITVFQLSIEKLSETELRCAATVSKGTYIRTLAQDIGAALGCGGVVTRLHRTQIASFDLSQAITFKDLETLPNPSAALLPADTLVSDLAKVELNEAQTQLVKNGGRLRWEAAGETQETVRLYGTAGFMGVASLQHKRLQPTRLFNNN